MTRKIAKAKWVVCAVRDRHSVDIIEDGAVLHEDGVILEVGPSASMIRENPAAVVSGSDDQIILPGFVNAHHHVGMTPLQLGSPDLALELWLSSRLSARKLAPYLDTLYSAFEMIASGVLAIAFVTLPSVVATTASVRVPAPGIDPPAVAA